MARRAYGGSPQVEAATGPLSGYMLKRAQADVHGQTLGVVVPCFLVIILQECIRAVAEVTRYLTNSSELSTNVQRP